MSDTPHLSQKTPGLRFVHFGPCATKGWASWCDWCHWFEDFADGVEAVQARQAHADEHARAHVLGPAEHSPTT